MNMQSAIARVLARKELTSLEMQEVMRLIMTGEATEAQVGGFLIGLSMKGETVDEVVGAARLMRELVTPVQVISDNLVDTCGTGGDGSHLFNVSTAAAIVSASAGVKVAKHGNRSISSKSGSADLLEAAGVRLDLNPHQVGRCIDSVGLGFMFAPVHHSAMRFAVGPRRELGVRTIFNMLGPLTNPAAAPNQVMGVFSRDWLRPMAEVLKKLGSRHVLVVHSEDGLDEISLAKETHIAELKDGEIQEYSVSPEELGIPREPIDGLLVKDAQESLALVLLALSDISHPASKMVALNAGAALYVAGKASSLKQGVAMALDSIAIGLAKNKLSELVDFTKCLKELDE